MVTGIRFSPTAWSCHRLTTVCSQSLLLITADGVGYGSNNGCWWSEIFKFYEKSTRVLGLWELWGERLYENFRFVKRDHIRRGTRESCNIRHRSSNSIYPVSSQDRIRCLNCSSVLLRPSSCSSLVDWGCLEASTRNRKCSSETVVVLRGKWSFEP